MTKVFITMMKLYRAHFINSGMELFHFEFWEFNNSKLRPKGGLLRFILDRGLRLGVQRINPKNNLWYGNRPKKSNLPIEIEVSIIKSLKKCRNSLDLTCSNRIFTNLEFINVT